MLHIELVRWADVLLIAPLSAHCLAKVANGLCDDLLTNVTRAWDPSKTLMLAPAMHASMWAHPHSAAHLQQLPEATWIVWPTGECLSAGAAASAAAPSSVMAAAAQIANAVAACLQLEDEPQQDR